MVSDALSGKIDERLKKENIDNGSVSLGESLPDSMKKEWLRKVTPRRYIDI